MPMPPVDPIPLPDSEFFAGAPLDAQEASYFAASARISSFLKSSINTEYIYSIGAVNPKTPNRGSRGFGSGVVC